VRTGVVAVALALLVLAPLLPRQARAQFSFDARRYGMGGVSLSRDGNARRFNPAYRALKTRGETTGTPKFSIPVPIGLIKFFKDHPINQLSHDPMFDAKSTSFNPFELTNLIFNPPIFYEVKKSPTPTNNVEFTVGKNQLILNLGGSRVLIPEQEFGLGSTSRLFDAGAGFGGFHVGVMGFLQYDVAFSLDSALRRALTDTVTGVRPGDTLSLLSDAIAQAGLAPTVSFAGRLTHGADPATDDGLYLGGAVHYYLGATYGRLTGPAQIQVGNPIFGTTPAVALADTLRTSNQHNGKGVGGDVGFVWVSGPFEVGVGVNDIGAQLTWSDTKVQNVSYITTTDEAPRHVHRERGAPHGHRHHRRGRCGQLGPRHGDPRRRRAAHGAVRRARRCLTRSAQENAVRLWWRSATRTDRLGRRILHTQQFTVDAAGHHDGHGDFDLLRGDT